MAGGRRWWAANKVQNAPVVWELSRWPTLLWERGFIVATLWRALFHILTFGFQNEIDFIKFCNAHHLASLKYISMISGPVFESWLLMSLTNTPYWNWWSGCWRQYHYVVGPLHWGSDGCHWDSSGRVQWLTRRSRRRLELEFSFLLAAEIIQVLGTIACCVSGNVFL